MIQVSESLSGSKEDTTTHDILLDGKRIGYVNVSYLGKGDVKTFRKYSKRKLVAGQPYSVQFYIDAIGGASNSRDLGKERLHEIVLAVVKHFDGLEERDVYVLELNSGGKTIIGRGSEL